MSIIAPACSGSSVTITTLKVCFSALLLVALGTVVPAVALDRDQRPEPYGRYFIRAESVPSSSLPPLQSAPEGAAYLQRVQEQVWRQGPYGAGLSETLLDAANYFQGRGDIEQAIVLLRRSVHLTRINDGLNSDLQLPLLDTLLENYINTGDLEAAEKIQAWRLHVQRQNYQPGQAEYIEATVAYAAWQSKLWMLNPTPDEPERLLRIWTQLGELMTAGEDAPLTTAQLRSVVFGQLRMLYLISVSDFGLNPETELSLGRSLSPEQAAPDISRSKIQHLKKSAYTRGMAQLKLLQESYGETGAETERAEVQRQLADWHLWFGNKRRAARHYGLAWDLLAADASGQYRQAWFAEPVELPAGDILYAGVPGGREPLDVQRVNMQFSVSDQGKAGQIETLTAVGEEQEDNYRLKRLLKKTRFRPRMEAGELVETPLVRRQYELDY
jgi:hypothetical protein